MTRVVRLRPPSGGLAPPTSARLPDGTELDLVPLARKIADAHLARHPEELERYGEAVRAWCATTTSTCSTGPRSTWRARWTSTRSCAGWRTC